MWYVIIVIELAKLNNKNTVSQPNILFNQDEVASPNVRLKTFFQPSPTDKMYKTNKIQPSQLDRQTVNWKYSSVKTETTNTPKVILRTIISLSKLVLPARRRGGLVVAVFVDKTCYDS